MNQCTLQKTLFFNMVTGIKQKEKESWVTFYFNQFLAEFLKMNFSFPAWCWEEWQERLSPWRWGFQLTGTTLMCLITRLPLASAAASLQPRIYIYLSCCHLYFGRSTTLSLLHITHKFPWGWPASCALPTQPSTPTHTHTHTYTQTHTHTHLQTDIPFLLMFQFMVTVNPV